MGCGGVILIMLVTVGVGAVWQPAAMPTFWVMLVLVAAAALYRRFGNKCRHCRAPLVHMGAAVCSRCGLAQAPVAPDGNRQGDPPVD